MVRTNRDKIAQTSDIFGRQRWRILIRTEEFLEDLEILYDKLWLFLNCATADREKFGEMARRHLGEYESVQKRIEEKWQITAIPTWAILYRGILTTKTPREKLESCYDYDNGEKPLSYPPVRVIQWHPFGFLDLRLDLTKPLKGLLAHVEAELKKYPKSATRYRSDKFDNYFAVWDLRRDGLSADEIAQKLWPKEYIEYGGRDSAVGEKGPLIQRVYDCEKAAQKLIDTNIQRCKFASKIKT